MPTHKGHLARTFEFDAYGKHSGFVEFTIEFTYTPGTTRSHPSGHWNRAIGSWDPPDSPEWEIGEVTYLDLDGKRVVVGEGDWFWRNWVVPLWDSLEESDFVEAVGG